jgi:hypothetical protein
MKGHTTKVIRRVALRSPAIMGIDRLWHRQLPKPIAQAQRNFFKP